MEKSHKNEVPLPSPVLADVPELLRQFVEDSWRSVADVLDDKAQRLVADDALIASLCRVWACSDFVARACVRDPQMLLALVETGDLQSGYDGACYQDALTALVDTAADDQALGSALRQFRRREMVRIAWRDIAGWADLDETLRDLSALAAACVDVALNRLHQWQINELGEPRGEHSNEPQSLVVLGMGKLGAYELNFSSDIDLIFAFAEKGQSQTKPQGARAPLSNSEYFTRLARRLINVIHQQTAEGFVFRVDMRLRPFGDAGPLVMHFDAMEDYYQSHGREWERYAMIKANVIAGDKVAGARLMAALRPFVYRRYLDYGVFESLREMKAMIAREVKRKGMADNIKLGPGGIREVEFTGQAFQLVRGGCDSALQIRPIQQVLSLLAEKNYLPGYVVDGLKAAYVFLRRAENRLQAVADQQTHTLPGVNDEAGRQRLAYAMDYPDWSGFEAELRKHMSLVHDAFEQVFAAPQREQAAEQGSVFDAVWKGNTAEMIAQLGYSADASEAIRLIERLREGSAVRSLSAKGRERLDRLMPLLLGAIAATEQPQVVLVRVVKLIESIVKRTSYLALLVENPMALSQLVRLCDASLLIADRLAKHPVLLDELLDARTLYAPLDRAGLEAELSHTLEQAEGDLEQQMERLRHFKQTNVLRVAAADVSGVYPLMVVSDHLTEIAEVVLKQVVRLACLHLKERHGCPQCHGEDGQVNEPDFMVLAYGKLGGIELGYSSDLDLVFLHGNYKGGGQTSGPAVVENAVFFARLGQRIIHIMTTLMPGGILYEIDARLRPSGASGLLVSPLNAFAKYQENQAWTWEHQALVRARVVVGAEHLGQRFNAIRAKVLGRQREPLQLQKDVCDMREKMRRHLSKSEAGMFDLKQDHGGIADIEFMVQYAVLRWAHEHPALLRWTDNIRLLDTLAQEDLLSEADAELLADAYRAYRAEVHRLALQEKSAVVDKEKFTDFRLGVTRIWRDLLETVK